MSHAYLNTRVSLFKTRLWPEAMLSGLAVVTTDMPLLPGSPDPAGPIVKSFCEACGRCARDCPGRAIPAGPEDLSSLNGWPLDGEACYETWRKMGTDCGICISTCPFTGRFDWKALEETRGDRGKIRVLLDRLTGGDPPRPYDPAPPSWWR